METFIDKEGLNNNCLIGTYIAIFFHLIIWATCLFVSEFARRRRPLSLPGLINEVSPPQQDGIPETIEVPIIANRVDNLYTKVTNAAKDSLLMIVIATLATQTGYGATTTSAILAWIFFIVSVCWILSIIFFDQTWIPLILLAIALSFISAIFALSFQPAGQPELDLLF
ncbi:hypothetical protein RhiirA5_406188 [Rhizophagus irregularis]|uniref:Transmembrane protein n=2 Tax=Rhizophagus irregularis TaxID=588596 RepID=U9U491_RHIID|nr:hypothetical protein GLOIN_2v1776772 [Rhizophagus irregularis DAOM 181602=DAOM 197198]PKC17153.1 hypothetical protein RhiirA5_406188 [Rhizophagus irregularis]PKC72429.1 hypothetical protein RhiirA1_452315 [Rhizophagus irregularis]PKK80650.1 hypothetical protein RhiirC2_859712 [Rhizophagus irregularis]PKY15121.1 hypothetical protein RhiirB3_427267 [Rhizophagus irregularis]POG69621.1 hypothetical protein GLOIN_2v1776772 [Rhizophagus irregularis DAOM 181602=DAOM 197198]|eukprot:XP_025176487.1 hypothetical protein GLOIN_2v1776772 [Rhizophagus irregularis DAOM 181602=DAOM 197198]